LCLGSIIAGVSNAADEEKPRVYENRLVRMAAPQPLLADYPQWVRPIREAVHFETPPLVQDDGADLSVRAWRFSYNARGIIELPNQLCGKATAVIVVHPWGIDDGQGWRTPEPAGCALFCTPDKNRLGRAHLREVVSPFVQRLRGAVGLVVYSEPGREDPVRKKLYRSVRGQPTADERREGQQELAARLNTFDYRAGPVAGPLQLSRERPVVDYFRQFPGLDAGDRYNGAGFWSLPIPVHQELPVAPADVVYYDAEGYPPLRDFLRAEGIRHVLLTGYCTDMCVKATTAGYVNLRKDFNVFLVGDATLATFPAADNPATATSAAISFASLDLLITQVSWVAARGKK
jgi:hypothetical protein